MKVQYKLKPCPFCGGNAVMHTWRDERFRRNPTRIECDECGVSTTIYDMIRQAVAAWNKRLEAKNESI